MKRDGVERLVSWMWTGAALVGLGLFFVIRGWLLTDEGMRPLGYRGGVAHADAALVMGILVTILGVLIALVAVVARLRRRR